MSKELNLCITCNENVIQKSEENPCAGKYIYFSGHLERSIYEICQDVMLDSNNI